MTEYTCDLCGQKVGHQLIPLKREYQYTTTFGGRLEEVCVDCEKDLSRSLFKFNTIADQVINEMRQSWFERFFRSRLRRKHD